jgi:hypothetical protein
MPTYSNVNPPIALYPGDIGFPWNNELFPADGTAGAQFALPEPSGFPDEERAVRWQTIFGTNPTAVNITLQAAMADVDSEYKDMDTSTVVGGEARTVTNVRARFLRAKKNSSAGGSGLTVKILP